ncbi:phage prohead protease%2C HK97 family [Yersinia rohdei]|uniref:Phage prohead protease, HK97 family n=1 Tax=Yersinia rohdei TaxID=29485 RepID=A0A0U1HUQ8_YERRO|nr:phage major capsid protein [Yersinia rohdei]CQI92582.1 phage prohead protease%2C HK97 family [Yersinia rohdei]
MKMKKQTREISLSIDNIDSGTNTVLLAFSSEQPVTRNINGQDYNEVLLHGVENVDLSRLNNKAALLFNHDFDKHIGVIETASIDPDRFGRALVRFSEIGLGAEKYKMVVEKTLTKVSVGYEVLDYRIDGSDLIVTSWLPYEISMVSVPADDCVGVGRSLNDDEEVSTDEVEEVTTDEDDEVEEVPTDEVEEVTTDEVPTDEVDEVPTDEEEQFNLMVAKYREQIEELIINEQEQESETINTEEEKRVEEIKAISRTLKISNEVRDQAIKAGSSITDFKNGLTKNKTIIKDDKNMKQDLNAVIRSMLAGTTKELDFGTNGVKIDMESLSRAFRAGVNTTNANGVISNEVLYGSFVDILRAQSLLGQFPIQMYTGLTSEISIPKLTADFAAAFDFVGEDGSSPEVDANFESIKLKPRTFTGAVPLTRSVLNSCPQVEQIVAQAIVAGSATRLETIVMKTVIDQAVAAGNVTSVQAYDYATLVAAQGRLGDNGVQFGNISAIMSPSTKATLRNTLRGTNTSAVYLLDDGDLCGVPAYDSKVLAGAGEFVILGDFSNIAIGEWGSLELDIDDTTNRNKGSIVARVWADLDVKLTRTEAFHVIRIVE